MTSIQAAMNQLIGSTLGTVTQLTAPARFAQEQAKQAEKAKQAEVETLSKEQELADVEAGVLSDVVTTAKGDTEENWESLGKAYDRGASVAYEKFKREPTLENYEVYQEQREQAEVARQYAKSLREEAEAHALDSIQTKTQGQTEQKSQLEQRIEFLKQLNQEGIMSNTQTKKYIHRLGGNQ